MNLVPERFAHDAHRVGAGGQPLASVRDELFLDEGVRILRLACSRRICHELGIAKFTHAKHRNIILSFHDSKLALRHAFKFPAERTRLRSVFHMAIREGDGKAASSCQVA